MAVGLAVMVFVLVGGIAVAFRLGRSSAAPNAAPSVAGAAAPAAPDPKMAALDDRIARYNINLRQIEQDEQKIRETDQEQQANSATNDPRLNLSYSQGELVLTNERNALGESTLALYRQIQSDPAFAANYRETVYTTLHAPDSLVNWSNLRYIERR